MNELYKSLFIEKISKCVCFIKYRNQAYTFEKPFKLDSNSTPPTQQNDTLSLIDCTTNQPYTMYVDDVLMFYTQHENDQEKSIEELAKTLTKNGKLFSQFKFIRPKRLHDLFFRTDLEENSVEKIRNIKILEALQLDDLEDYTQLFKGDPTLIGKVKSFWQSQITKKLDSTIQSLDEEIKSSGDESVTSELESIKEILNIIPIDSQNELSKRNTIEGILEYWPTLLLPRSTVFDIS